MHPEVADDQWLFRDAPFIAELCLMLLVAVRHQVERELIRFAARAADGGKEIEPQQYDERLEELRLKKGKGWQWEIIATRLNYKSCEGWKMFEALRLLANCYKHDLSSEPDDELLELLQLETGVNYLPLPDSNDLREGLAVLVGLEKDAEYCDITERFLDVVDLFVADVKRKANLSRVKPRYASLNPRNAAR